jgi:hypothetical protein
LTHWITRRLLGLQLRRPSFDRSADIGGAPLDLTARFVAGFRAAALSSTAAALLSVASLAFCKWPENNLSFSPRH